MRKLFVFAMLAGLVGMGGFVRDARAGATIDLLFVGINGGPISPTSTVSLDVSDTATMALIMTNDQALTLAVFSVAYDLAGPDTMDVVSAVQWGGLTINKQASDFFAPLAGLNPISNTFVGAFQGATTNLSLPRTLPPAGGAFAGGYQMGTIVWHAVGPGPVTFTAGIINAALDAFGDSGFNNISSLVQAGVASANVIPEPGTASLLGLGLVGLVLMGRRSRS
jgi:hypothetical protein